MTAPASSTTVPEEPSITSGTPTAATTGSPYSFTVTTTGGPAAPAITTASALPAGISLTDNGDGTATLGGTPAAGTGGSYPVEITADNGVGSPAVQDVTLVVDQSPTVTSAATATFTAGTAGTFVVTTSGSPVSSVTETGTLPAGVTFTDTGDGTATLSGTPAAGTGGSYPITITADNGVGTPGGSVQAFTLVVDEAPTITSAATATVTVGSAGSVTLTTSGFPAPTWAVAGALPAGLTFTDNGDGTATLAGTPAAGTGGGYLLDLSASNGVGDVARQTLALDVEEGPSITSTASTTLAVGSGGTFTVTSTGSPPPALSETGTLPAGVTFTDDGDGTATLAGTPAAGSAGDYPLTLTADNGVGTPASQQFTLVVQEGTAVTSVDTTTFTAGTRDSFTVTTGGFPAARLTETGTLPTGVTFTDDGDGTATLAGTPAAGSAGDYPLTLTADNGVGTPASQQFTLEVGTPATVTSASATTFTAGTRDSFTVTTGGFPVASLSETGNLPAGVTFTDDGDGTATLAGDAAATAGGVYVVTIQATDGIGSSVAQTFVLTVDAAPAITTPSSVSVNEGVAGRVTVTTSGYPTPTVTVSGILPPGMSFANGVLSGTPTQDGSYPLNVTAVNGVGRAADENVTVSVVQVPTITSASTAVFNEDTDGRFAVTTSGFPTPGVSITGTIPTGVVFANGAFSGTPTQTGSFPLVVTAANGVGTPATQRFTLTVYALHVTTSTLPVLVKGTPYAVQFTASGATPTVRYKWVRASTLPKGLKLSSGGLLSGTVSGRGTPDGIATVSVEIEATTKGVTETAVASLPLDVTG